MNFVAARPAGEGFELRHALEDAWRDERVMRRWQRFALPLDETLIDSLLQACAALPGTRTLLHDRHAATEGWALETRGYLAMRPEAAASTPAAAELPNVDRSAPIAAPGHRGFIHSKSRVDVCVT